MDAWRTQLIVDHLDLAKQVAWRLMQRGSTGPTEFEDVVAEGHVGLVRAATSFDPGRHVNFGGYAQKVIAGTIIDAARRHDPLTRTMRGRAAALSVARVRLEEQLHRMPTAGELADETGWPVERIEELRTLADLRVTVSLDYRVKLSDNTDGPLGDAIPDDRLDDPLERLVHEAELAEMHRMIGCLPARDQTVLGLVYGQDMRLWQAAEVLGVTESRVSQIRSGALRRLRSHAAAMT